MIKAKDKIDSTKICKVLKEKVDRKSLRIQDVKTRQDGAVVVELLNEDSVNELKDRVTKSMGDRYDVALSEALKPTVKMLGMADEMNEQELKNALIEDNPILSEMSHFKLRKCFAAT